jgi:ligand-binding sensor domain-containing protein
VSAAIVEDHRGDLWIAAGHRLIRRRRDGRLSSWGTEIGIPKYVRVLMEDREGRLWVGGAYGYGLRVLDTGQERPSVVARYSAPVPATDVVSLFQDGGGSIWVGGSGLACLRRGDRGPDRWITFETSSVLGTQSIASIVGDTQGHLWLAVGSRCRPALGAGVRHLHRDRRPRIQEDRLDLRNP